MQQENDIQTFAALAEPTANRSVDQIEHVSSEPIIAHADGNQIRETSEKAL